MSDTSRKLTKGKDIPLTYRAGHRVGFGDGYREGKELEIRRKNRQLAKLKEYFKVWECDLGMDIDLVMKKIDEVFKL